VESAFLAEARERGEPAVAAKPPRDDDDDENEETQDAGGLPPLDDLVQRIPANVRDALNDLFRVKFVRVQRVPKSALKP
jgi:hypothetical protein